MFSPPLSTRTLEYSNTAVENADITVAAVLLVDSCKYTINLLKPSNESVCGTHLNATVS